MVIALQKKQEIFYNGSDDFTWKLSCSATGCPFHRRGGSAKYPDEGVCQKPGLIITSRAVPLAEDLPAGPLASRFPFLSWEFVDCGYIPSNALDEFLKKGEQSNNAGK